MGLFDKLYTNKTFKSKSGQTVSKSYLQWWVVAGFSLLISVGTWNPTGLDLVHYFSTKDFANIFSYLEMFVVLMVWVLGFVALYRSVGKWGILALGVFILLFFGGIVQNNWLDIADIKQVGWFLNLSLAFVLWFGIMAPRMWKFVTGQYTTNLAEGTSVEIEGDELAQEEAR